MLPNLIVIGAPKSGTSSLHHYLGAHPEIYMSRRKELQLFSDPSWREHLSWYEAQFPTAARVRGESSPGYSMHPTVTGVPERMHELLPDARLIYLVRDPIDRLVSHYVEWFALAFEDRSLPEALADHARDALPYVSASLYAAQLDRYLAFYPRAQVLVVDCDDLVSSRRATLVRIFSFLGVDPGFSSPAFDRVLNLRAQKWRLHAAGWWLVRRGRIRLVRALYDLRPAARDRVLPLIARRVETPVLDPGLREALSDLFRADTVRLRAETGQPFAGWSI